MRLTLNRITVVATALLLSITCAHAQRFGGNPTSTKWRQIDQPRFRIIFTEGHDSAAQRSAAITAALLATPDSTIGPAFRKLNIILQPDLNFSNAYVGLGPYRSEFYTIPPQDPFALGAVKWVDNLTWHEVRHGQQYSNFNRGLSKVFRVLWGENGQALANAMSVPDWFFEGDAVWSETQYTQQGRGRMPSFFNEYRSINLAGKDYSYAKLRNGSYKHFVPSHYHLGYLLTAFGREQFGAGIWRKVSEDAAAFKTLLYPWQGAFRRHTGERWKAFTNRALADFRQRGKLTTLQTPEWVTGTHQQYVVNYTNPQPDENGNIIALKTSFRHIPAFVRLSARGEEEQLRIRDIAYDHYFSYRDGRLVYAALQPDARWQNRDYSVLRVLDVNTNSQYTVKTDTRFFSPDIQAGGETLVAIHADGRQRGDVVILNTEGTEQHRLHLDGFFFSHPKFTGKANNEVIAVARSAEGYMGMLAWVPGNNPVRWLQNPSNRLIGFPYVSGDSVFYTATADGYDALVVQSLAGGPALIRQQYASGNLQGVPFQNKLVASYRTADGWRLGTTPLYANSGALDTTALLQALYPLQARLANMERNLPQNAFEATRFRKGSGLFNFHSWQPEVSQPEYAISLLGNNLLNTTFTTLGYRYNLNENSHAAEASFVYGGWYVQPFVNASNTWGREVAYNADTVFVLDELKAGAGLQLPLNFTGGRSYKFLNLQASINQNNVTWKGLGKDLLLDQSFTYWQSRVRFSMQSQQARQHIYPRLALAALADYRRVFASEPPWQSLLSGSFFLPGVHRTHNLVLNAAAQSRDTLARYTFTNSFPFSRGYEAVNFPRLFKVGANYHFPLLYPDLGVGNIFYIYRLRANAFYDHTRGKSLRTGLVYDFASTGGEVYADLNIWNQLPLTIGVRYSYLLNDPLINNRKSYWELILPLDIL